jgi:hypothetical protein
VNRLPRGTRKRAPEQQRSLLLRYRFAKPVEGSKPDSLCSLYSGVPAAHGFRACRAAAVVPDLGRLAYGPAAGDHERQQILAGRAVRRVSSRVEGLFIRDSRTPGVGFSSPSASMWISPGNR